MGGGKRQAFSSAAFLQDFFAAHFGLFGRRFTASTACGAMREATLRKCVTAPLAQLSLLVKIVRVCMEESLLVNSIVLRYTASAGEKSALIERPSRNKKSGRRGS